MAVQKSSGLSGPFSLTNQGVDAAVVYTSAGAYALGHTDANNVFNIYYVGRADGDVNKRLKDHVSSSHSQFKFAYFSSAVEAYRKECSLYHDFNPPENIVHPAAPTNSRLTCVICGT